jgi:putative zinc finger/helix-turn-helix YgiT family protein
MGISETCVHKMDGKPIAQHETRDLGIPLVIYNAVHAHTCQHCGLVTYSIPFPERLAAAAAVCRAKMPEKLSGNEIRFIRKALKLPAKDMSDVLQVAPETFSRWENDKAPINPTSEKLLRILAGLRLGPLAPAVGFRAEDIIDMSVKTVLGEGKEIVIALELVTFKNAAETPPTKEYTQEQQAA